MDESHGFEKEREAKTPLIRAIVNSIWRDRYDALLVDTDILVLTFVWMNCSEVQLPLGCLTRPA